MTAHVAPATLKADALARYEAALNDASTDWRATAGMLASTLHFMPARKPTKAIDPDAPPAWWSNYRTRARKADKATVECVFFGGVTIRTVALSLPGKGFNIGRALTMAVIFYRLKVKDEHASVPGFSSVTVLDSGETFDVAECNRMTDAIRATPVVEAPAGPSVADISVRIATLETELARRKDLIRRRAWENASRSMFGGGSADPETFKATYFVAAKAVQNELAKLRAHYAPAEPEPDYADELAEGSHGLLFALAA